MEDDDQRVWPRRTPERDDDDPPWNPQLRRTADRFDYDEPASGERTPWESLPPSARLHGTPTAPSRQYRRRRGRWRHRLAAVLALVVAGGLVAGFAVMLQRASAPVAPDAALSDPHSGVGVRLPAGWREIAVPPVTGFTTAARDEAGGLLMIRKAAGVDLKALATDYAALLLQGDRTSIVTDSAVTHAVRAEYDDVVNRPAYLRVTLLTPERGGALLVGLLQPDDPARRRALDTLMDSVR
ncbi:hypothetical protein [Nonomuraea sp. NPDC050310]|uniref:hypothetical protein n=1 Tax=unclassified Nonomuraea TaxID=2593643 RepID=UPI00340BB987